MPTHYLPMHTLRHVCQLCTDCQARHQTPVALSAPEPRAGGTIVMLDKETP